MALGYDGKLYILAFDHRGFVPEEDVRASRRTDSGGARKIADAKHLIYEGMTEAVNRGAEASATGLVDSSSAATSGAGTCRWPEAGDAVEVPASTASTSVRR